VETGRLQAVALDPEQPDPFGHRAQQLHRFPPDDAGGACGRPSGRGEPSDPGDHPGLGDGQAAAGEQGEPVASVGAS
jgi:hypothetical protein